MYDRRQRETSMGFAGTARRLLALLSKGAIVSILSGIGGVAMLLAAATVTAQTPGHTPGTEHVIPSLEGPVLYATYCAVCHGKAATGDGPMAPLLKVRVPNLTEIAKRNGGTFPFERVQKRIEGSESAGLGHGTREMPVWGPIFSQVTSDRDFGKVRIYNVTKYLQSIQK